MYHWSLRSETATDNWVAQLDHVFIVTAFHQWHRRHIQISDVCFVHLLSQYSCTLLSTGFKSGELSPGHSWGGINFRVTISDNAVVACARCALQISQDSVETLFRWGGIRLHNFAANLFRKLRTKFRQNCPSFYWRYCEKQFGLIFSRHTVYLLHRCQATTV